MAPFIRPIEELLSNDAIGAESQKSRMLQSNVVQEMVRLKVVVVGKRSTAAD